mgnify:CR=1 FL=1
MTKNPLFQKSLMVLALFLLLTIPITMIQGKLSERVRTSEAAKAEIASRYADRQVVSAPVVYISYREKRVVETWNKETRKYERSWKVIDHSKTYIPNQLNVESRVETETRFLGIYSAPVFESSNTIQGSFSLPDKFPSDNSEFEVLGAYLLMGVSDMRGIADMPAVVIDGSNHLFTLDSDRHGRAGDEMAVDLGTLEDLRAKELPFHIQLDLRGSGRLGFVPAAVQSVVRVESDWPHPGFTGLLSTDEHEIGPDGFSAVWKTNQLSAADAIACAVDCAVCIDESLTVAVDFVQPVTGYLSTERAIKYSYLFVGLTFIAFLLFEVMKRLRIHAVQYSLVGLALAMFYLLLLSLSEHLSFDVSYLVAGVACVSLITFYVRYVLRSVRGALGFGSCLAGVYGILYVVLLSEDYALLMGSLVLFLTLAIIMVATRRLDWHDFSVAKQE